MERAVSIHKGPHGAKLEYEEDADPWIFGGYVKWACWDKTICGWPFCQCDLVAVELLDQDKVERIRIPSSFRTNKFVDDEDFADD